MIEVIFGAYGAQDGGADVAELKKGSRVTGGERDRLAADLRRKYDTGELFQSDWYRHYKKMFFG